MSVLTELPPQFSLDEVLALAHEIYGFEGTLTVLESERDQNVRLTEAGGQSWVIKIANGAEDQQALDFQAELLSHVFAIDPALPLPHIRKTLSGERLGRCQGVDGRYHFVRAVSWLPGKPFALDKKTKRQFDGLGETLGRLTLALQGFAHAGAIRDFDWDLNQAGRSRARLQFIDDPFRREIITYFLDRFDSGVAAQLKRCRAQVIHADANNYNVFVDETHDG